MRAAWCSSDMYAPRPPDSNGVCAGQMRYCPRCARELGCKFIDGRERMVCADRSCGYVAWENPIPVVAALIELENGLLLARNKAWPRGMYSIITGFLERDETPEAAVLREVREELGLAGSINSFLGYYPFFEMNQLVLAFHVQSEGKPKLGAEIADVQIVAREQLQSWSRDMLQQYRVWAGQNGVHPAAVEKFVP